MYIDIYIFTIFLYIYLYLYLHIYTYAYAAISNGKRKPRQFPLICLQFVHHANGDLSFVHLFMKRQTKVICLQMDKIDYGLNGLVHLCLGVIHVLDQEDQNCLCRRKGPGWMEIRHHEQDVGLPSKWGFFLSPFSTRGFAQNNQLHVV